MLGWAHLPEQQPGHGRRAIAVTLLVLDEKGLLFVTHDIDEALIFADRVILSGAAAPPGLRPAEAC